MADILIDSVINRPAIEGEVSYVAAKVKEIEMLIAQAKTGGIQILGAQNFKEFEAAQKNLTATQQELTRATKEAEAAAIMSAKAKQAEANAAKALAQQQLAETRLREANEKAANREAVAVKKAEDAKIDLSKRRIEDIPFTSNVNPDGTITQPDQASAESIERANAARDEQVRLEQQAKQAMSASAQQTAASTTATNNNTKANQGATTQLSKYKDNLEELTGTLDDNQELQGIYKQELAEISTELKNLQKNTDSNEKSTEAYQKKVAELLGRQNALKKESSELSQTIKNQVKEQNNAAGSVDALRARLNLATQAYDKLSQKQRESPLGRFLKTEVVALTGQVSTAEQSLGKFQRNVGNYKNSIVSFANGAFGALKKLALFIPGLGLAGLISLIVDQIVSFGKELFGASKSVEEMSKRQQELAAQVRDLNKALEDQINFLSKSASTQLEYLQSQISLAQKSGASQATIFALRKKLIEEEIRVSDEALELQIKRAEAEDVNYNKSITGLEALDNSIKAHKENVDSSYSEIIRLEGERANVVRLGASLSGDAVKRYDAQIAAAKSTLEVEESVYNDLVGAARNSFNAINALEELTAERRARYNEAERKAIFDLYKFNQNILIQQAKDDITFNSGDRRIAARERLLQLERDLIIQTYRFEKSEKDLTASQILLIERKKIEGLKALQVDYLVDLSELRSQERQEALNQAEKQLKEIAEAEERATQDRIQKQISDAEAGLEGRLSVINKQKNAELLSNAELYAEGKISKEQYELEKQRIENESLEKSIQKQIEYYTALAFLAGISAQDQKRYLESIDKLKDQLAKLGIKRAEDSAEKETDIERKKAEGLKALAREVAGLGFDLLTAGVERQKNEVQDLIDLLEQQKQKDIEVANQTIANATERANAIAVIEARAAAQREALERRQRELNIRRARFERAEQIANIIANTASAVTEALPNIALSILAGAIGAAQLVRVLATPIPRYATGVTDFAGGYAILGDGGRHEVVVEPGKKPYLSGDSDELHHLAPGTDVYPSVQAYEKAVHKPATALKSFSTTDLRPLMGVVEKSSKRVERAIRRIPQTVVNSEGNWSRHVRRGNNTRSWINRNL